MVVIKRNPPRHGKGISVVKTSSSAKKKTRSERSSDREEAETSYQNPAQDQLVLDRVQSSPYFLASGDNPSTNLVAEVLTGTNYNTWSLAITTALEAKNKLVFVDGSLPRPFDTHPHFKIWSRCNSMVKSWLLSSVSKEIYSSILRFNDSYEIWKDLQMRFHITSLPRSYQITQKIWNLQQGSLSLSAYYTKLKTLWDDLEGAECVKTCSFCQCCKSVSVKSENSKIIKFLSGLNESYSNIKGQIIMKKTIPDLAEVYNLLDQDFSQRSINPTQHASAFQIGNGQIDQSASVNASYTNQRNQKPICSHCGYTGHTMDKCYKIHGYPPGFKSKAKQAAEASKQTDSKAAVAQVTCTNDENGESNVAGIMKTLSKDQIEGVIAYFNNQLKISSETKNETATTSNETITATSGMAFSNSSLHFVGALRATCSILSSQSWIIDSGATHHVSRDKSLFENITESVNKSVSLPTGLRVKIAGVGSIRLNDHLVLNNVLFIPDFHLNLLSISQLTKDVKCRLVFDDDTCMIQDPIRGLTIGRAEQVDNLYVLDRASICYQNFDNSTVSVNTVFDSDLWHNRLGHPSECRVDIISKTMGLKRVSKESISCKICPLAKQKRLPFVSENNMCSKAFNLLHIDVWGPFSICTNEGYKYFLTIVDDYTRITWVYLLKAKSDVLHIFPDFITMVEKQYQTSIKAVRADNAPELRFEELYRKKGITAFHSCPETPEQNSVVERKHQHILNVARALMFQASVPLEYWGECVLTSVFLINRIPTPLLNNKSPYQMLHSKLPNYTGLRVFGCLCFSSTSSKGRHKFQPRSKPCVFLGYLLGYKGYKLLDLETNAILISRNVVFHEEIFPFHDAETKSGDLFGLFEENREIASPTHHNKNVAEKEQDDSEIAGSNNNEEENAETAHGRKYRLRTH